MRARLAATVLGALALLTVPRVFTSDGLERWRDLQQLLHRGTLSASQYSLVGPLFATPLALFDGQSSYSHGPGAIVYFNILIFFLGLFALWKLLAPALGRDLMATFTAIAVFASMFPAHTVNFYAEVFTAMALGVGAVALVVGRPVVAAILLSLGAANTPAAVVPLIFLLAVHARAEKRAAWLLLPLVPVAEILLENLLRRGSLFSTGYEGNHGARNILPYSGLPGFSYPFLLGVISILLSFGKGLVFFTPGLFAYPRGNPPPVLRRVLQLWYAAAAGFIVVYAKWWDWSGDEFWGPRLFLFCSLPASLALAWWVGQARERKSAAFALAVLALSFWVGFDGVIFGEHRMDACYASDASWIALCWYAPEFSALVRPFVSPRPLGQKELIFAAIWLAGFVSLALPLCRNAFRFADRERAR